MQNVAVLDRITLAFNTHFAAVFGPLLAVQSNIIIISDRFRADKSAFKIAVNNPRRF